MKKLVLAATAALVVLTTACSAQAEQYYERLPNGQFVRVEPARHFDNHNDYRYSYAPVYYPQPRYYAPPVNVRWSGPAYYIPAPPHPYYYHR